MWSFIDKKIIIIFVQKIIFGIWILAFEVEVLLKNLFEYNNFQVYNYLNLYCLKNKLISVFYGKILMVLKWSCNVKKWPRSLIELLLLPENLYLDWISVHWFFVKLNIQWRRNDSSKLVGHLLNVTIFKILGVMQRYMV